MGTTLEKLLSIQAEEKAGAKTAPDSKKGGSEREEAGKRVSPHPPPETRNRAKTAPKNGDGNSPPGEIIRDVWGKAFRLYARCAPALRTAAENPKQTEAIFLQAAEEARIMGDLGEDGIIVGAAVLEMLDEVWKQAREKVAS